MKLYGYVTVLFSVVVRSVLIARLMLLAERITACHVEPVSD